jgi:hypothetical protein
MTRSRRDSARQLAMAPSSGVASASPDQTSVGSSPEGDS